MFLRSKRRCKNGKWHRYWSVLENRWLAADHVVQLGFGDITKAPVKAGRE